jgi:hypothetical protein
MKVDNWAARGTLIDHAVSGTINMYTKCALLRDWNI